MFNGSNGGRQLGGGDPSLLPSTVAHQCGIGQCVGVMFVTPTTNTTNTLSLLILCNCNTSMQSIMHMILINYLIITE